MSQQNVNSLTLAVTPAEIDLINKALEAYEAAPQANGVIGSIMDSMVSSLSGTKRTREETILAVENEKSKTDMEVRKRRLETARIRLKLLEATERQSEFTTA